MNLPPLLKPSVTKGLLARVGSIVAAALALLPSTGALAAQVYAESASIKVQPGTPPKAATPITLAAAKNEFEAFQVVVHADGEAVTGVRATASDLRGPGGSIIPASAIQLYRVAYLDVSQPSGTIGKAGTWPDGLVPAIDEIDGQPRKAFPFDVPAGESRAIWVDVLVPTTATPGAYSGTVHVDGSGVSADVVVSLTVYGFQLPSTPSLSTAFLAFSGNICSTHTGDSECGSSGKAAELMSKYGRLALDHRITLPNIFIVRGQKGDWSAFDSAFGPLLDGTAATRLAGAKMTSAQYTWQRDQATFGDFAAHFREKGWFDRLFDYTADEPPYGSNWADIPGRADQAKAADPSLRTLVTTNIDDATEHGLADRLDTLVPIVNDLDGPSGKRVGDQRSKYDAFLAAAPSKRLWTYQSCMSHGCSFGGGEAGQSWPSYMVDVPGVRNRLMQWADFREKVTGELYYETVGAYSQDAWKNQRMFDGNGDGTLFYPGTPAAIGGTSDVPLPSIRLKLIREGIEDFEYLELVSKLGDPELAQKVASQVLPNLYSADQSDPSAIENARRQLARRIEELGGGKPGATEPQASATRPATSGSSTTGSSSTGASAQAGAQGGGCGGGSTAPGAPLAGLAPIVGVALAVVRSRFRRSA
ncbi:MAG: DUF4091 domain-containing protein [Myxococcales bacterium]